MARKPRIESNDGLYHIINRGNYRRDLFYSTKTKRAFESTIFEACEKSGWWLYAYVILRNHYHLAIATPKGNLISGMQWLQSTFANRFNRLRGENGHLFQGRYKSLVVEPGTALCEVVNYIHLNPVRAGIVRIGHVADYSFSSLPKFLRRKREKVLHCKDWLNDLGRIEDKAAGWREYLELLRQSHTTDSEKIQKRRKRLSRGWCIGSRGYKKALVKDLKESRPLMHLEAMEVQEHNELGWETTLEQCLRTLKKKKSDIERDRKSAEWKLAIALLLKERTSARNGWIAGRLNMGEFNSLSHNVSIFRREQKKISKYYKALKKIKEFAV